MDARRRRSSSRGRLVFLAVLSTCLAALAGLVVSSESRALESRTPVWTSGWTPPNEGEFYPSHLARGGNGDLYVAGHYLGPYIYVEQWAVVRFTADGTRKWVRYFGSGGGDARVFGMAADTDGNVVVVGSVWGESAGDWAAVCWKRNGDLAWTRRIAGSGKGADRAADVAPGPNGSFYVAGTVRRTETGDDGLLVRYGPTGRALWKRFLDGPSHGDDALNSVATDLSGNAYVAGCDFAEARTLDALVARYSPSGRQAWKKRWGAADATLEDVAKDLAVRGSLVAMAGISGDHRYACKGLTLKYDTSGKLRWARTLANQIDPAEALRWQHVGIDTRGRVAVAGFEVRDHIPEGATYWATIVYGASGGPATLQTFHGDEFGHEDACLDLTMTAGGRVYECGRLWGGTSRHDGYVVSLSPSGVPLWDCRTPANPAYYESAVGIVATSRAVYVATSTEGTLQLLKLRP